ncbi:MAG: glycosyltransferase [Candidatus Bathyarchaeia archaeon]
MKAYFGACGIGFGHVGRCIPIAEELAKEGFEILFSTYSEGLELATRQGFPCRRAPPIGFAVKSDGGVDFRTTTVNPGPFIASYTVLRQIAFELMTMRAFRPNIVISDSRVSTIVAAKLLKVPCITILNQFRITIPAKRRFVRLAKLADFGILALIGRIWTLSDWVLIPDFPLPYTISIGNLRIPKTYLKKVFLMGPILPTYPENLPDAEFLRKKLMVDPKRTLIFAPISGPVKERMPLLRLLEEAFASFPEDYEIVMSQGRVGSSEPRILKGGCLRIHPWIENRFEYLKACDLVISRAGHGTVAQTMIYGKPSILIPTPDHTEQIQNAIRLEEMGIAKVINQHEVTPKVLLAGVMEMLRGNDYAKRSAEVGASIRPYNGVNMALEIVQKSLGLKL